ncbi:butyrophilin subfamily 2 member A2 isoform X2 [Bombina bombina]|uniref:butyrophilin subfamily 2 member A2 isoform X2 n=1 Tax=Bombina bombina TaxID=8345 RepID=UPI00235AEA5B|nr:butyrophilin subfamily 2 member A2 isoform X2 [Bombina bombina]
MERLLMCLGIILIPAASAKFQVQSEEKLVAAVGSDILLPCNLSPPLNRTGLEIRWFYNLFHSIVFLMREGREERQDQIAEFRGRAFLRDGPETGDLALSLLNVRLSDAGAFHCFVEDVSNQIYEEAVVNLSIVGKGSPPHIDISLQGSFIRLSCFSSGWYPEQKTHWLRNNKTIKPDSEASHKQSDGLFTTESEILLNSSSEGHFYCGVKHSLSGLETGAYIIVSDLLRREIEWRKVSVYKESIFFDPLTAFHGLLISPNRCVISTTDIEQNLPENPERFDTEPCVLGSKSFSSGCHYWETEIQERDGQFWSLGIARQSVRRMGGQRESPESGIWAIRGTADGLFGLSEPQKLINCTNRLNKVGTFLDYERETLSFYDVETFECLFQYTQQFTEPVYPYYYVGPGMSFVLNSQSHR